MRSKINNAKQTDGYSCLKIKRREERDALLKKIGQCQRARDDRTRVPNTILIPASLVNEHLQSRLEEESLETWPWPINRAPGGFSVWQQT